jgi:hypothetical protein
MYSICFPCQIKPVTYFSVEVVVQMGLNMFSYAAFSDCVLDLILWNVSKPAHHNMVETSSSKLHWKIEDFRFKFHSSRGI